MTVRDAPTASASMMDDHGGKLIEMRNASVRFEMDRGSSRVMDDVSMDIYQDEILGVVGESGSGKSMFASALLNAIVDPGVLSGEVIYHPPNGEPFDVCKLDDDELKRFRWEEIALVFQGAMDSFNPTMSIGGHFEETLRAHDYNVAEGMAYGRELLAQLYLDPDRVMRSYPHELSGGMQQRALIALSLLLKPNVLVMDEPTAALDLLMQRSITSLLAKLHEEYGITMVFITHDLPLVADLADRLAVMYAFEFVEVGPTREIIEDARHPYTRALLNATPNLDAPLEEMQPIEGSQPAPINVPEGCSYAPRCTMADVSCQTDDPPLRDVGDGHAAACPYSDDVESAIPPSVQEYIAGDGDATTPESTVILGLDCEPT
jgi:oligopeptide/dipeptide ABC transporter ATP-binding protein